MGGGGFEVRNHRIGRSVRSNLVFGLAGGQEQWADTGLSKI